MELSPLDVVMLEDMLNQFHCDAMPCCPQQCTACSFYPGERNGPSVALKHESWWQWRRWNEEI